MTTRPIGLPQPSPPASTPPPSAATPEQQQRTPAEPQHILGSVLATTRRGLGHSESTAHLSDHPHQPNSLLPQPPLLGQSSILLSANLGSERLVPRLAAPGDPTPDPIPPAVMSDPDSAARLSTVPFLMTVLEVLNPAYTLAESEPGTTGGDSSPPPPQPQPHQSYPHPTSNTILPPNDLLLRPGTIGSPTDAIQTDQPIQPDRTAVDAHRSVLVDQSHSSNITFEPQPDTTSTSTIHRIASRHSSHHSPSDLTNDFPPQTHAHPLLSASTSSLHYPPPVALSDHHSQIESEAIRRRRTRSDSPIPQASSEPITTGDPSGDSFHSAAIRPLKRTRYNVPTFQGSIGARADSMPPAISPSSSSALDQIYSDDEVSDDGLLSNHNHSQNTTIPSLIPSLVLPNTKHKLGSPTLAARQLDGLLKNFAQGLQALAPHLKSSQDDLDQPVSRNVSYPPTNSRRLAWPSISDIERDELVRLLLQTLKEIGYPAAAMTLEVESGFSLDPSLEITSFRENVLSGRWNDVDALLKREYVKCHDQLNGATQASGDPAQAQTHSWLSQSLFGVDASMLNLVRFLVAQEKYLELLESRRIKKALVVLRTEVTPLVTPLGRQSRDRGHKSKSTLSTIGNSLNKLAVANGLSESSASQMGFERDDEEDDGVQRLCLLSSLMMCGTAEEVREKADWEGVNGGSRVRLLEELQDLIPPQKLLPHQRMAHLLEQAKSLQRLQCLYHATNPKISLLSNHSCARFSFPTETSHVLSRHTDEVWRIQWSHDGIRLATSGRSRSCIVWKIKSKNSDSSNYDHPRLSGPNGVSSSSTTNRWYSMRKTTFAEMGEELEFEVDLVLDKHPDSVSCVAWSPDDSVLLTGSDCTVTMWNTKTGVCIASMAKHRYEVSSLAWLPDGKSFISGGMDSEVRFWDLKGECTYIWRIGPSRIVDVTISPDGAHLVAIGVVPLSQPVSQFERTRLNDESPINGLDQADHNSDSTRLNDNDASTVNGNYEHPNKERKIHLLDVAKKRQVGVITHSRELSCVSISDDSRYALINQAPNEILLYSLDDYSLVRRYVGQKQGEFLIRSCFGGGMERNFVLSGSEDGKIYVWHMETGSLVEVLGGHTKTANAVSWNPCHPAMFASASDDHTVRIWQAPGIKKLTNEQMMDE